MRDRLSAPAVGILMGLLWPTLPASATPITFTGGSGTLAARVDFNVSGTNLIVTLTNTSSADVLVPTQVLTAVFFNIAGNPVLSPLSAVVAAGSNVLFGTTDPGNVVGGEMAYRRGLTGTSGSARQGISSTGLGLFGPGNRFPGNNLQGPASPAGLQYGLTSATDDPTTGNTPVTGTNALIRNSVVFTLAGLSLSFLLSDISDVSFQYGTSLLETSVAASPDNRAVPVGSSWTLLLAGFVGIAWVRRRERHDRSARRSSRRERQHIQQPVTPLDVFTAPLRPAQ